MVKKVVSEHLLQALQDLDIGNVRENVRRVVIDMQAGHMPIIHVEHFGDDRVIEVFRALEGVDIRRVPSDHDTDAARRLAEANRVATDYLEEHRLKGPAGEFLD